jgi:hypothetical protein
MGHDPGCNGLPVWLKSSVRLFGDLASEEPQVNAKLVS